VIKKTAKESGGKAERGTGEEGKDPGLGVKVIGAGKRKNQIKKKNERK